jgi:hypothetical protein
MPRTTSAEVLTEKRCRASLSRKTFGAGPGGARAGAGRPRDASQPRCPCGQMTLKRALARRQYVPLRVPLVGMDLDPRRGLRREKTPYTASIEMTTPELGEKPAASVRASGSGPGRALRNNQRYTSMPASLRSSSLNKSVTACPID